MKSKVTYYGKPIEDYSKEELIQIIIDEHSRWERDIEQHERDLELFMN